MKKRTIISVGGSIVIPKTGFDVPFLKKFKTLILKHVRRGHQFILVIGGGGTCRDYQQAAKKTVSSLTKQDLDWIGIHSTHFNAQFVKYLFKGHAAPDIIVNPHKIIRSKKPIIIGAGYRPGHSTDMDAVLLAKKFKAKQILNLSNIDYVYTKDPNKYKDAKKIKEIDWASFRKNIVGNTWDPGKNAPFDPIASKESQRLGLEVGILRGTNLKEVDHALSGKVFKGTIIR